MHITYVVFFTFLIIKLDFIVCSKYKEDCNLFSVLRKKREKPKHINIIYYMLVCSDFNLKATSSLIYNGSKNTSLGYKLDRKNPNKLKPISILNLLKSSRTFLNHLSL